MSDIPRYKPVPNDRYGITDDADGKLCEYRDYEKLKSTTDSIVQSFAANVLRLGNEVRDLSISNAVLRDDNARLKAEVQHWQEQWHFVIEDNNKQMDELARLRASSFVTAVPVEQYERVVKAGDAMYVVIYGFNWLAFNKDITNTLDAWNAAKEGKPSEE